MKCYKTIIAISILGLSSNINAALIDFGSYTTDDVNGLDWLDTSFTVGLSKDQVDVELQAGGSLNGWQFATEAQMNALFDSAGGTGSYPSSFQAGAYDAAYDIVNLLGSTGCGFGYTSCATLILGDEHPTNSTPSDPWFIHARIGYYDPDLTGGLRASSGSGAADFPQPDYASALIRTSAYVAPPSAVPVPAAFWLFGSGLIGLVGLARRKRV